MGGEERSTAYIQRARAQKKNFPDVESLVRHSFISQNGDCTPSGAIMAAGEFEEGALGSFSALSQVGHGSTNGRNQCREARRNGLPKMARCLELHTYVITFVVKGTSQDPEPSQRYISVSLIAQSKTVVGRGQGDFPEHPLTQLIAPASMLLSRMMLLHSSFKLIAQ